MANTTDAVMAKQERRVRAQWKGGCKVELTARGLAWMADEPKAAGGEDAGPT
ncbi:MAG: osmotically inducible protein C, partial [Candidatus Tectomicrobia bacterium]|nr:osmotically inducible protein C [Candidatus Tectomicrobia bacterium]